MIALAIAANPRLLIADEPTTALDVTIQKEILDLLSRLQKDLSMSVILITHNLAVVSEQTRCCAVMRRGEVVETGPAEQILTRPTHVYTRSLLAAVPTLRTDRNQPLAMISQMNPD